jgi:hypothetical protein
MAACLQTELQLTKTLPQPTTELVNFRMVAHPSVTRFRVMPGLPVIREEVVGAESQIDSAIPTLQD